MNQKNISALIGAGAIGLAVIKEINDGEHVILADLNEDSAKKAAQSLTKTGISVSTACVDVTSRASLEKLAELSTSMGKVSQLVVATGVSPSTSSPEVIFKVDLLGVALALDIFSNIIVRGGVGLVIGSQAGHRLKALGLEQDQLIAKTPADELLNLPICKFNFIND